MDMATWARSRASSWRASCSTPRATAARRAGAPGRSQRGVGWAGWGAFDLSGGRARARRPPGQQRRRVVSRAGRGERPWSGWPSAGARRCAGGLTRASPARLAGHEQAAGGLRQVARGQDRRGARDLPGKKSVSADPGELVVDEESTRIRPGVLVNVKQG